MRILKILSIAAALAVGGGGLQAAETEKLYVECGGSFSGFVAKMKAQAEAMTYPPQVTDPFFGAANYLQRTINADRRQGIFNTDFIDFSRKLIAQYRLDKGRQNAQKYDAIFSRIEQELGVPRGILLSFWAFETDFGAFTGDFNTLDTLMTLSHDCRRPELFQPQVFAALELYARGQFSVNQQGAWAGEVGQVQMLPMDIMQRGYDGDGDGTVDLDNSVADSLFSGANMLRSFGWRPNEPWMQEVVVPDSMPWEESGVQPEDYRPVEEWAAWGVRPRSGSWQGPDLEAALMLPMGHEGPAFIIYPNYQALFEWNQSFVYVATAAYFATRLEGAPVYDPGNAPARLSDAEMKALQRKLVARGHDVGEVDGILGAGTRAAVQAEQERLGLPADAWPTRELLNRL
ncbi:peptidoglycan-binding protein [Psychromarinibacter sp. C21-152]|uniref:Peptidoglycan-binding protein n=1 Tax=Psychromarinibacter sediminicola TaxID=3033385 RepID=A0AAE3NP13_9RHOB|nr:peptidoglycan-binding protein [Psychromarinibacter sediminicola]MDF0600868.1 peptidoglycan-binding protein [Psychromarinibacter sediminicola]